MNIPEKNIDILTKYSVTQKKFILFCYHPVSSNIEDSHNEWKILLETIIELKEEVIFIKPNIDYGNEILIELFNELNICNIPYIYVYNHIDIDDYKHIYMVYYIYICL